MITLKTVLTILIVLITLDFITTFVAVEYMGATEINPLFDYFDNIKQWLLIKFLITVMAISIMTIYIKTDYKTVYICFCVLVIIYLTIVTSNIYQIYHYLF